MCGRFAVYSNSNDIAKIFAIKQSINVEPSYNVAPTENIQVIFALPDGTRSMTAMRWGLIPSWQNTPNLSNVLINARIETVNTKPSFKQATSRRRCLIIADGFYEWRITDKKIKQPYFIYSKDAKAFAMAGIWEKWIGEGGSLVSCCIITIEANELLSPLHNRMPAIINPADYDVWLDPTNQNWDEIQKLITNKPHENLTFYQVSTKVNSAKYKNEDCIKKLI